MRMWMVDPKAMCRKHLLGEHVELHMLVGSILKDKNIKGFIIRDLCEPKSIISRHNDIVKEMLYRGYKHQSHIPLKLFYTHLYQMDNALLNTKINQHLALFDLISRCSDCKNYLHKKVGH